MPCVIGWYSVVYRSVNISVCISFHIIFSSVRLYALFSPHCRRRCCGFVDVASMSGALVSGAHENMP